MKQVEGLRVQPGEPVQRPVAQELERAVIIGVRRRATKRIDGAPKYLLPVIRARQVRVLQDLRNVVKDKRSGQGTLEDRESDQEQHSTREAQVPADFFIPAVQQGSQLGFFSLGFCSP